MTARDLPIRSVTTRPAWTTSPDLAHLCKNDLLSCNSMSDRLSPGRVLRCMSWVGYRRSEGPHGTRHRIRTERQDFQLGKSCRVRPLPRSSFAVCPSKGGRERTRNTEAAPDPLLGLQISGSQLPAVSRWYSVSLRVVVDAGNAAFIQQQLQRRAPLSVWGRDCRSYPWIGAACWDEWPEEGWRGAACVCSRRRKEWATAEARDEWEGERERRREIREGGRVYEVGMGVCCGGGCLLD